MPASLGVVVTGSEPRRAKVAPASVLRNRPLSREPTYSTLLSPGSTCIFSPLPRPMPLPWAWNCAVTSVTRENVAPWSVERITTVLALLKYEVPASRYSTAGFLESSANDSMPIRPDVGLGQAVVQRHPPSGGVVPAVGAADVRAGVEQPLLRLAREHRGHVAAAAHGDVAPAIAVARAAGGRGRCCRCCRCCRRRRRCRRCRCRRCRRVVGVVGVVVPPSPVDAEGDPPPPPPPHADNTRQRTQMRARSLKEVTMRCGSRVAEVGTCEVVHGVGAPSSLSSVGCISRCQIA